MYLYTHTDVYEHMCVDIMYLINLRLVMTMSSQIRGLLSPSILLRPSAHNHLLLTLRLSMFSLLFMQFSFIFFISVGHFPFRSEAFSRGGTGPSHNHKCYYCTSLHFLSIMWKFLNSWFIILRNVHIDQRSTHFFWT